MNRRRTSRPSILILAACLAWCVGAARAEEAPSAKGRLEVGEALPAFELETLAGERLGPAGLQGESPLVLVFFRGTW